MKQPEVLEEVRRYARAAAAGIAIALVMLVTNPLAPLTYVLGIARFAVAGVIYRW